ncbi:hypothetical protein ACFEDX_001290, partial [Neisseria gonorrhoeae]
MSTANFLCHLISCLSREVLPGGLTTVLNCTEHAEQQPPVTIRLNRALSEYRIDIDGKTFYIDVLLEFD